MSDLLDHWSKILAYLGDHMFQDGYQNTNYSNSPSLTPEELNAVNKMLLAFVESLDKHPEQKEDLLKQMREFDPTEDEGMRGGKPKRKSKKSKKTRRNRRK